MAKTKKKITKLKKFANSFNNTKKNDKINNKASNSEIQNLNSKFKDKNYFLLNYELNPPYNILIDTNFIHQSVKKKINIEEEFIRCLFSNVNLFITECVYAELELLGDKLNVARSCFKTIKHEILKCDHKGNYADDCIFSRVSINRCYIVATCDTGLKVRIRRIPGVPLLFIAGMKYTTERMPVI